MATKFPTTSSVKIYKQSPTFGTQNFCQIKVITLMKNYNESVEINHNSNWLYVPDYPDKILIIGGWGSDKTNTLLNLIKHQWPDIDKIYLWKKLFIYLTSFF